MIALIHYVHMLAVAVLVGKVVLLSFVVAPILAKTLERESFSSVVRQLFPAYYTLGMGAAIVGVVSVTGLGIMHDANPARHLAAAMWLTILATETYCRSSLTPQSNAMRERLKEQESRGGGRSIPTGLVESFASTVDLSELDGGTRRTLSDLACTTTLILKEGIK